MMEKGLLSDSDKIKEEVLAAAGNKLVASALGVGKKKKKRKVGEFQARDSKGGAAVRLNNEISATLNHLVPAVERYRADMDVEYSEAKGMMGRVATALEQHNEIAKQHYEAEAVHAQAELVAARARMLEAENKQKELELERMKLLLSHEDLGRHVLAAAGEKEKGHEQQQKEHQA